MTKQEMAEKDYLAGMKYKDIAAKYDVSINTVKSWKKRNGWVRGAPKRKIVHPKTEKVASKKEIPAVKKLVEDKDLTDKQKMFCIYYLQRFNATWAYQKAYGVDYETARRAGSRMLTKVDIKKQLTELKKQQAKDLYLDANDILIKLAKQAFADYGDYLEFGSKDEPQFADNGDPLIDLKTGKQVTEKRSFVYLKNKEDVDTSLLKKVTIGRDGVIVELHDQQAALKLLLDRLPEPEVNDDSENSLLKAIGNGLKKIWSDENENKK